MEKVPTLLFIQIETAERMENTEDMLNVKGIDGVFVGPDEYQSIE